MNRTKQIAIYVMFVVSLILSGCVFSLKIRLVESGKSIAEVDINYVNDLRKYKDDNGQIPLERVFYKAGFRVIDSVTFLRSGKIVLKKQWQEIASDSYWLDDTQVQVQDHKLNIDEIQIQQNSMLPQVKFHSTDINPFILYSLGLTKIDQIKNNNFPQMSTQHLLFIYIDAFGYLDYEKASQQGLIPNLNSFSTPILGITTYPSITNVFTASLLTGKEPEVNQVDQYGIRQTILPTFLDEAAKDGLKVTVIEGYSIYFKNLNQGELITTPGRKGVTVSDQDMMVNVNRVLDRVELPNLLWIHFYGLDDTGHAYGPWSTEYITNLKNIDGYIGDIINKVANDTIFVITSDHGMHPVIGTVHQGSHGNLIAEDMFTFIDIFQKK